MKMTINKSLTARYSALVLSLAIPTKAFAQSVPGCYDAYNGTMTNCESILEGITKQSAIGPTPQNDYNLGSLPATVLQMFGIGPYNQCVAMAVSQLMNCMGQLKNLPPQNQPTGNSPGMADVVYVGGTTDETIESFCYIDDIFYE
jgi:hypothetical protein